MSISKLFYLSLFLVVAEGIFRKWLLPSLSTQLFSLKYLIVVLMWIVFFSIRNKKLKVNDYPYYLVGFIFVLYALLDLFVSYLSIKIWILGLLFYFTFVIYIFVVPIVLKSYEKLDRFFIYFLAISVLVYVVGIIQFYLPTDHLLNIYATTDVEYIATSGERARITSIFNYITGNSTFLSLSVPFVFGMAVLERSRFKMILLSLLFFVGLFNVFATGSRLVVYFVMISLGAISIFVLLKGKVASKIKYLTYIFVFFGIIGILYSNNLVDSYMSYYERISTVSDSSSGRALWVLDSIVEATNDAGLTGFGIGSTSNTALSIGESVLSIPGVYGFYLDQPMGRLIMEIGILGFVLFVSLILLFFFDLLRKVMKMRNYRLQVIAFVLWTTLFQYVVMMNNIIFNWMGSVHFWLVVGLVIAIKRIDQKDQMQGGSNG